MNFFGYDSLFSARLGNLIAEKKISMQTLSTEIGVSRQAISQYCNGSTVPNADKLLKIAEYFNVSLDYLCGRSEAATTNKDLQFICDYTGLSESTIRVLHQSVSDSEDLKGSSICCHIQLVRDSIDDLVTLWLC